LTGARRAGYLLVDLDTAMSALPSAPAVQPRRGSEARFSYVVTTSPSFRIPFPARIDVRIALLLPRSLALPPRVERAVVRTRCRHVTSERGRCAAFALGTSRRDGERRSWYIFTLQSDIASLGSAVLRDHLRGWRKALFTAVLEAATSKGVATVFLASAQEVFGASLARQLRADVPPHWTTIYDATAEAFGMSPALVDPAVNIQVLPRRRPCWASDFHSLELPPSSLLSL
jgi:hypothetical protein